MAWVEDLKLNLERLHLRANKIEKLTEKEALQPGHYPLTYLNLRENQVTTFEQLNGLDEYLSISQINLLGTPLTDEKGGDLKKEILILYCDKLTRITKINKEEVAKEDYEEARNEKEERRKAKEEEERQKAEEERQRLEEEERAKKEAEENPDGAQDDNQD